MTSKNIRNTHPSLQKLNKDLAYWQSNELSARTRKREFEIKQATDKVIEISTQIQRLAQELPEIREAEDRITRSQKADSRSSRLSCEKITRGPSYHRAAENHRRTD